VVFAANPVSVYDGANPIPTSESPYDVDGAVPIRVYVPEALELRYTQYPVAPVTGDHARCILLDDAVAPRFVGAPGIVPGLEEPELVVAEAYED